MLKLRYYLKKIQGQSSIVKEIICHRKSKLLEHNLGFVTEVFNLCCKIDKISFWHGIQTGNKNNLNSIKRAVKTHYFKKDADMAANKNCIFSILLPYSEYRKKEKYKLFEIFRKIGMFSKSSSRIKFIKALLNTNSYLQECKKCHLKFYDHNPSIDSLPKISQA